MTFADKLALWLVFNYVLVGIAYGLQRDWWRVLYWIGAVCIVFSTIMLRR